MDYAAHWAARHDCTPVLEVERDVHARAAECPHEYLFLVRMTGETRDVLGDLAATLDGLDGVVGVPPAALHATVKLAGFRRADPSEHGDLTPEDIDRLADAAAPALEEFPAFQARFPRLNVFPAVVFCEVRDGERLCALHERLLALEGMPRYSYDGDAYTPHVSLASFETEVGFRRAVAWTERNRAVSVPPLRVEAVELVHLDLREPVPDHEVVRRYPLGERSV